MMTHSPFSMEEMDIIEPITRKASNGHCFILVAINYFTKWIEAKDYMRVTKEVVTRLVRNNLVCRFDLSKSIIFDNARNRNNDIMIELCQQIQITHKH